MYKPSEAIRKRKFNEVQNTEKLLTIYKMGPQKIDFESCEKSKPYLAMELREH